MKTLTVLLATLVAVSSSLASAADLVCYARYTIENDEMETGSPIAVALREHEARHAQFAENGIQYQVLGTTTGAVELALRLPNSSPITFNGSVSQGRPMKITLPRVEGVRNRDGRAVTMLDVFCGLR